MLLTQLGPNSKGKVKKRSRLGKGKVKDIFRPGKRKVKERSRQGREARQGNINIRLKQSNHKHNHNYNLMGFDTIEINLVFLIITYKQ